MTRSDQEMKALEKLGVESFRNVTKGMVIELCSNAGRLDPSVAKSAMEQIPRAADAASSTFANAADTGKRAIESADSSQKQIHDTASAVISACGAIANDQSLLANERMEALRMMDKAAEREERCAEATRQSNERIFDKVIYGAIVVTLVILAPIVDAKVRIPRAA